jgi:hypothetical protein
MPTHHHLVALLAVVLGAWACDSHGLRVKNDASDADQAQTDTTSSSPTTDASSSKRDAGTPGVSDARSPNAPDGASSIEVDADTMGPWTLPHSGGPTWRSSTSPYCHPENVFFNDLWSDSRGVYVITDMPNALYFNSGKGWTSVTPQPSAMDRLSGLPGGALVLYGQGDCGAYFFDGKQQTCALAVPGVEQLFVAGSQRIHALIDNRLFSYDGSYFVQNGGALPKVPWPAEYRLWADEQVVVVTAEQGKVYRRVAAGDDTLVNPTGQDATAVWGFARDDLWLGDAQGRLSHWDGTSWSTITLATGACARIEQLWGASGVLFAATDSTVYRVQGGLIDVVLPGPCLEEGISMGIFEQVVIARIWGNSPEELFIALMERKETRTPAVNGGMLINQYAPDACDQTRLYWFDGQRLGRL